MEGMEKSLFPISISGIDSDNKENFPHIIGDGKMSISIGNGVSQIKCEEDNSMFNFDSLNLSQSESDTSKEVDLSRSFDFFLEGERLVSSLCGPKIEDKNTHNTASDRTPGRLQENNTESLGTSDDQYESYDKFLSSLMPAISPRKSDCVFKKIITTEKDSQFKTFDRDATRDLTIARNKILVDKTDFQTNIPSFPSEYPSLSIKDEFKVKPHYRNWGLLRRSPISDLRKMDDGNHPNRKYDKSSPFKINDLDLKLPFQYESLVSKNKDFPSLSADGNVGMHCTETETKILSRSRDYALCFTDNSKTADKKSLEEVNTCDQTDTSDYEISFRKSAIEGCLVFEQIIRDFQLKSHECDLQSYCRNVKRCVSIANSLESDETVALITQLILCSLKLAESWSTLNSYFGANGNNKCKPKTEDDCRLLKVFKQWQVGSKSILDCLILVIQSLKSCTDSSETEKTATNNLEHISLKPASDSNPFFNIKNVQFNSDKSIFKFEETDKDKSTSCSKEMQGNLLENSRMSSFFNCIRSKQTNPPQEINDPSNLLLEIQQKAQNLVSKKSSVEEKKTKRKWLVTSLDKKRPSPLINRIPGQNSSFTAQNQIEHPMPPFSISHNILPNLQMNKSIFENIPIPPMNFMSNPFSTTLQSTNTNTNSKDLNAFPQLNFIYPQTSMNFKPAVQNKEGNNVCKSEDLSSQSGITNQTLGFNRTNMYNQQQMNFMTFQPNFNYQPFSFPNDQKNDLVYRTNFCFPDGKIMPFQSGGPQQPPSAPFFYPQFCSNAMHQMDSSGNKYNQDKRQKSLVDNSEGDENSETYCEIKSYMKPGSYRVPSKSTPAQPTTPNDNLNYIFEDIIVTGITVPLTKTESFSPSKKSASKTNVAAKKSPPSASAGKQKDSTWRAAVASAESIGKLVENLKHHSNKESSSQESNGQSGESSKASATESVICLGSETDSKESDSPNKSD